MWLRMDGAPGRFAMKPKKDLVQSLSSSFVSLVPFLDERQNLFSVAFGRDFGEDVQQSLIGADHKCVRSIPQTFLPYMFFSFITPN